MLEGLCMEAPRQPHAQTIHLLPSVLPLANSNDQISRLPVRKRVCKFVLQFTRFSTNYPNLIRILIATASISAMNGNVQDSVPSSTDVDIERDYTSEKARPPIEKVASPSMHDGCIAPTEEELKTLRHVPDTLPLSAWLVLAFSSMERFSYFAFAGPLRTFSSTYCLLSLIPHDLKKFA